MYQRIILALLIILFNIPSHSQVNLSAGLVAYYPFNGSFNDASGNGNNGTGMNGVSLGTDQWGNANNAASFDGVDDWISIPPSISITPGHALTVTLRFKTNITTRQYLVSKSELNTYNYFSYNIGFNDPTPSSGTGTGILFGSGHEGICSAPTLAGSNYLTTGVAINSGQWNCLVVTFDTGVKKIFVNGALLATQTLSGVPSPKLIDSCLNAGLKLGTWCSTDPAYFNGLMDEVRIYNRELNTQEIDSFCNLVTPPPSSGIINNYAAIKSRNSNCNNTYIVDSALGFNAGDTVIMIQMKGATIDTSNSSTFGTILNYNNAGNYEQNIIKSVNGNSISLLYNTKRNYDIPNGKVQFVRVPFFQNYTITRLQTCMPWNGSKGGIYAINVANNLNFSDSIDVSGKGFRGGRINNATTYACNMPDYFYPTSGNDGAEKGEAITEISMAKMAGKGSLASGGGGVIVPMLVAQEAEMEAQEAQEAING